jgi:UDP-glucose 4-epimerase
MVIMRWSSKTVLVTGGAGFIGKHLSKRLISENARVIILDNFSYAPKFNVPEPAELVVADVSSYSQLQRSLFNIDVDFIFHLAAPSSVVLFNHAPVECFSKTIAGVINIFLFSQKRSVRKVIFPSSGSVYGNVPPPQSEDSTPRPINLYGIAKMTCEKIAEYYSNNVKYVGLRIFAGYGPGEEHKRDYASPVTLFLNAVMNDRPPIVFGDGSQSRDFVYIDDIVNAFLKAAESSFSGGIINVGSGRSYTFNEVISMINNFLGKNISPKYIEKPKSYLERTCADIRRMKEILGITPLDLSEGLKRYLETLEGERRTC